MSNDNISEFPGRKPKSETDSKEAFNSETNIQNFNQQLANLINASVGTVALITVIGSLEIMKADILNKQMQPIPMPPQGEKH